MTIRLTAFAEFDLETAQDFYRDKEDWVIDHFMNSIAETMQDLETMAGIHPIRYGHHCMPVRHFPFSIYYDIENELIIVKAILDNRFGPARIAAHFNLDH